MTDPLEDAITGPYWAATRERRLLLQVCLRCKALQHPPRAVCTRCASSELEWREVSGRGTIDAFTVVARRIHPELEPPYVVARIRLAEGPLLIANVIEAAPDGLACNQPVCLAWRRLADGRNLPVFAPAV